MIETLLKICELQPKYSSQNTAEMQERGVLVRQVLAKELRAKLPALQGAVDGLFDDLSIDASDGIGRKTEAPWVRIYSRAMSPTPRDGFYVVLHFAANGSAVFFTVGCGSTIWKGGDLTAVSDRELKERTDWGRQILMQRWGSLSPFTDQIELGATAPLPKTFEKATVVAKRLSTSELHNADVDALLFAAMERLGAIYLAQLDDRDTSPGDQDVEAVVAISQPLRKSVRRQGRGLSPKERKQVELRAMELAAAHLQKLGYECKDTSSSESYDLLATLSGKALKVEVKGTTSDFCESVLMTKNEVLLHRSEKGKTALILVSKIRLQRSGNEATVDGGQVEALIGWNIDDWLTDAVAFQVTRRAAEQTNEH